MNALNRLLIGVACSVIIVVGIRVASDIVGFVLFAGLLATYISHSPRACWRSLMHHNSVISFSHETKVLAV